VSDTALALQRDGSAPPRIVVVGLGKLGLPIATVLAAKGFSVVGLDIDPQRIDCINAGRPGGLEPGLPELPGATPSRWRAMPLCDAAIAWSDVSIVVVPTPSGTDGEFLNDHVVAAVGRIGAALRSVAHYHLVVVNSTVMPGSMDGVIVPALVAAAQRPLGDRLGVCYNPEFVALGSVARDMLRPDLIAIGESDARAGDLLVGIANRIVENEPEIHRMNFVNAELCKIAVNTFVTAKISYANTIAELCDRLPGADAEVVLGAAGADRRIGHGYLRGAVGYGGTCFPYDNAALTAMARRLGTSSDLMEATDTVNRRQLQRLCAAVMARAQAGSTVAILGMAYKPGTDIIEASQGIALARALRDTGFVVIIADPAAAQKAAISLGGRIMVAASAADAVTGADVVVITTPWPQFRDIPAASFRHDGQGVAVIDPWRLLSAAQLPPSATHVLLGRGPIE
jgi:UDPglucose 6-dehydrogenase